MRTKIIVAALVVAGWLSPGTAQAQDLTVSFSVAVSGTTVTYTAQVCNTGSAITDYFYLDVYYNRAIAPSCWDDGEDYATIYGLGSGACTTRTFTRTGAPLGSYTAWAFVDSYCEVDETNEGNNKSSRAYSVTNQPDLKITSFTRSVVGATVNYSVTFCNAGLTAAGNFWVDLYYNSTPPACPTTSPVGDDFKSVSGLAAAACQTLTFVRSNTPAGSYTSNVRLDTGCVVAETNEANNNASTSYTVASQNPDLRITASQFTASVTGGTVTFSVTVCNDGGKTATNFDIDLHYDGTSAPACNGWGDDYVSIASLAPAACTTQTFTRTGTPAGTYTAWVIADTWCSTGDSNTANNTASRSYTVSPMPDLTVKTFTASVSGSTVTFTAEVCNNGASTTSTFWLDVYYDRATGPGCQGGDGYSSISGLAAGACATRTFTRTGTPDGSYTAWARVDSLCGIAESDEGNNNLSQPYTVSSLADLTITSFSTGVSGSNVTFTVKVCNNGSTAASNVDLEIYYNLTTAPGCSTMGSQQATIPSLAAGVCATEVFTRSNTGEGTYAGWARVDADCAITESNENNNNATSSYTVKPDLVVKSFTTSVAGGTVTFDVTVCNEGGGISGKSFKLGIYYDRLSAPACSTTPDGDVSITGLGAGSCTTKTFTRTATPVGSYTGWAFVDSGCAITNEVSEANNTASSAYSVATQADLIVQSITVTVSGTTVDYVVKVCNNGGTDAASFVLGLYYSRTTAPTCSTTKDQQLTITSLQAGACDTKTFTRTGASSGAFTAWALADASCGITEASETNNTASASYSVGGSQPDFVVQTFTVAVSGTTVTYTVTVCNTGGATTADFYIDLFYNGATAPTCTDIGDDWEEVVGGLAAGACTTKTFTQTGTPVGAYTAWVTADTECSVTESNETNNNAQKTYTVIPVGVDQGVKLDQAVKLDIGVKVDMQVDRGVVVDQSVKLDTGVKVDSSVQVDSSVKVDQPPATPDSGLQPDGTPPQLDGAVTGDSGKADKGKVPPSSPGGCNCEVAATGDMPPALMLLALVGLVVAGRRRWRR